MDEIIKDSTSWRAEVVERALRPSVGIPIEPMDIEAAELRETMEKYDLVPRSIVGPTAGVTVKDSETDTRAQRAKGGLATSERARGVATHRRRIVADAFNGLSPKLRSRPFGSATQARVLAFVQSRMGQRRGVSAGSIRSDIEKLKAEGKLDICPKIPKR